MLKKSNRHFINIFLTGFMLLSILLTPFAGAV